MNVLVINCGSSSLKFQLINAESEEVLAKGICERIGIDGRLTYQPEGGEKEKSDKPMPTHTEAIQFVIEALTNTETGVVGSLDEIGAVGHRVVHGGEKFASSVVIDEEVKKAYKQLAKKYHPDMNVGAPNLKDLEQKFKQVQEAYDRIMDAREKGYDPRQARNQSSSGSPGGYGSYGETGDFGGFDPFGWFTGSYGSGQRSRREGPVEFQAAENYINAGHFFEARNVLSSVPESGRTAHWYYLSALANAGLGNNIRAQSEARAAVDMEPGNYEYQNLLDQLQNPGRTYTTYQQGHAQPGRGNSVLRFCATLWVFQIIMACCCGGRGYYFCC